LVRIPEDSRIVVLAAARNVERDVKKSIFKIQRALAAFKELRFVIVESYSEDATLQRLYELSEKFPEVEHHSIGNPKDLLKFPRTMRIANARNHAKEIAYSKYSDFDYVAVADLDNVNSALTKSGIESCWQHRNWNAMFANQGKYYYDIWALKHELWNPNDCWVEYRKLCQEFREDVAIKLAVKSKEIQLERNIEPVRVDSAFGGFGIYKSGDYFNSIYSGVDSRGEEICEHISFHANFEQKKFFINPKMINISKFSQNRRILIEKLGRNK